MARDPKNLEFSVLLDFYGPMLTDKQREIAELYFNEDLSLAEISENSGITRQGVLDAVQRARVLLWEWEQKLGLSARFGAVRRGLLEIRYYADEICRDPRAEERLGNARHILDIVKGLSDEP